MTHLNGQQQAAAQYIDGPLLVIAGAGSGKTRVITHKIAYLIETCGIAADKIYAVTFTNKAAREMQQRVGELLKKQKKGKAKVNLSTFHSLGLAIIRKEAANLDLAANFSLFDANDALHLLKELSAKVAVVNDETLNQVQHAISNWKNDLIPPPRWPYKKARPH